MTELQGDSIIELLNILILVSFISLVVFWFRRGGV